MKETTKTYLPFFAATFVGLIAIASFAKPYAVPARQGNGDPSHYSNLPDLAYVESVAPLSQKERLKITVADIKAMNQEELDQLYARLSSGPIPTGDFEGSIVAKHEMVKAIQGKVLKGLEEKGFMGIIGKMILGGICQSKDRIECLGEMVWSGKRFYAPNEFGEIQLRNGISTKLANSMLMRPAGLGVIADALKNVQAQNFNGSSKLMLFPAQVYCGQSLYDSRRESTIIDYAYGDDFQPFLKEIDSITGRNGLWVRDEIRMVRPGLYLGRANMERVFVLNFVLENKEIAKQAAAQGEKAWKNGCWAGSSWQ